MKVSATLLSFCAVLAVSGTASARSVGDFTAENADGASQELPAYVTCVPYARQISGIQIYGDAAGWWSKAEGKYRRGHLPRVGAVMTFLATRSLVQGHVAVVSRVIDSRTVLISHANWSPIKGQRGQIERNVEAVDVSPHNDWSAVRVWYDPLDGLGTAVWPVEGFIYAEGKGGVDDFAPTRLAVRTSTTNSKSAPLTGFRAAFADLSVIEPPLNSMRQRPQYIAEGVPQSDSSIRRALALYEQ